MRIDRRHLDDIESLPQDVYLPPEQVPAAWAGICDRWFALTGGDDWDDRRLPLAAAAIYGLPPPEQFPRPGQVAGWTHREWIGWAVAHGFEEVPRSKHAYQYRHRLVPALLLSMSSSPGDHRWSMATATDFRFAAQAACERLGANLYVAVVVVASAVERHPSTGARERLRLLRQFLLQAAEPEDALRLVAAHGDLRWEEFDQVEPDAEAVGRMRGLFATLQREFDCSPRAALRRCGHDQDEAALIAKRIAGSAASDLLPGELEPRLEELLGRLREERDNEERAKELLRAARAGEAPAEAAPAPAAAETAESRAAAARHALRSRLEVLRAQAAEAVRALDAVLAAAVQEVEQAALAPAEELERLRAENAELRARLAAGETVAPAPRRRRAKPAGPAEG